MKNIFILSTLAFVALSANNYAGIEVQMDQIKTGQPAILPSSNLKNGQMSTNGTSPMAPKPADMNNSEQKPVDILPNGQKTEPFIKDHDLSKAIYDAIRSDRLFLNDSKRTIKVTVYNGKVTLSGDVKTQEEKERAAFLATQINNLKSVTNDIKVVK